MKRFNCVLKYHQKLNRRKHNHCRQQIICEPWKSKPISYQYLKYNNSIHTVYIYTFLLSTSTASCDKMIKVFYDYQRNYQAGSTCVAPVYKQKQTIKTQYDKFAILYSQYCMLLVIQLVQILGMQSKYNVQTWSPINS